MAYVSVKSGYLTGSSPGTTISNNGGLRMYYELRCYTSAETVTIMNKSYSCAAGSYKLYYKLQGWFGIQISSKVRLTTRTNTSNTSYVRLRNGATNLWYMEGGSVSYAVQNPSFGDNNPPNAWYDVADASDADYRVYPEGLIAVTEGATLSLDLDYAIGLWYSSNYHANVTATSSSASVSVSGGKFTLSISQGAGTTATVKRGSTTLSSGATIYLNDSLTFTYSANTGYDIATHTVNGTSRSSGYSWTVSANATVVTTATVKSFILSISAGTGSTITVNRTSSPKQGASTGNLNNGATIYYSDVLKITFTASTGYDIATHTVNGTTFTSGNSHTVTAAVSVVSTATLKTFTLSINAGTGSTATVKRGSTTLSDGDTITYNDVLTITFGASTGYDLATHTVNGTTFPSGNTHTVTAAVSVVSTATVKSFTLSVSTGTGSSVTVNRTSSPKQGAATGDLSDGATIYYSDVLKITFTPSTGYSIAVHTVDGVDFTSGGSKTVTANVAVVATATVKVFTLTIDAGVGTTIAVERTSSPKQGAPTGNLSNGDTIYYSDVLSVTFAAVTGYTLSQRTINSASQSANVVSHTVTAAVTVLARATAIPITLSVQTSASGVTTTVFRSASPIGGSAAEGQQLADGSTVYYGDSLTILYSLAAGYTVDEATFNGAALTSGGTVTVPLTGANVVVLAKAAGFVYINGEPYLIYIGNGTSYDRYLAKIGNGNSFDNY